LLTSVRPFVMSAKKQPILAYISLAVLFLFACAYQIRAIVYLFPAYLHVHTVEWPFMVDYVHGQPRVEFVHPYASSAGIKENDILVSINGQPVTGLAVFGEAIRRAVPGDMFTATVLSAGDDSPHTVSIPMQPPERLGAAAAAILLFMKLIMPFFCIFLGSWVVAVRPRDISAWLLLLTLQFFCVYYSAGIESWGPVFRDLAQIYRAAFSTAWPIFMFLFGLSFPEPFPPKQAASWRWPKRIIIPSLLVICVLSVINGVGEIERFSAVASLSLLLERTARFIFVVSFVAIGCFFAAIGSKFSTAATPDAKRRLRLLYWGTTVSMTPAAILIIVQAIKGGGELEKIFPEWLVLFSILLMLLFPITLAYVIVVQRALDVRVVIRQGLQYTLATTGIRVLQILLTAALITFAVMFMNNRDLSSPNRLTIIALMIAVILLLRRAAVKLRAWIDRRFFRDAYNSEQILASLGDEVRSIVETRPLLERVASKIAESLHVPRVAVLLPDGGFFRPAYAVGYDSVPQMELPDSAATIERLRKEPEPARVYLDDEDSWVNTELPQQERQTLAALSPQLLLPLAVKDKLLGLVALGEKRSEEPYSGTDLKLLKSVATQTALALSNAQLSSAIADEVARREKLNREIEIAREVQERLFPQRLPEIAGLDYFGLCRTALGVGGDYYDFLALSDGKLGIALGDVSGKGIAAALTMASLQASLRADAMRAGNDLAGLIARVNNMVYDASTADRYATLFYAQFDPSNRRLTYVNAGHCPPILLRNCPSGRQVQRLDQGGTVVGLVPDISYDQADVDLLPGDLLVIYTDGFSEAMNLKLEEWGEKRLLEAIKSCDGVPPKNAIYHIMQAADSFAAGAPQSDDMTLVILRAL
jgi:sigma-B regulation protein RsbU (phosphoserine phosphatase)